MFFDKIFKRNKIKNSTEEQIKQFYECCYTQEEVDKLLKDKNLSQEDFNQWITGQTGLLIYVKRKEIFGYFKSDVDHYIYYKSRGKCAPIYD